MINNKIGYIICESEAIATHTQIISDKLNGIFLQSGSAFRQKHIKSGSAFRQNVGFSLILWYLLYIDRIDVL